MRFTTLAALGAFAVAVNAQSTTMTTATYSVSPAESSASTCFKNCKEGDVDCQSHCVTVPSPDKDQANNTNKCVADCDQGDGSTADSKAYADCVNTCIQDNFYATSVGTPEATGVPDSGSDSSGSDASATDSAFGSSSTSTSGSSSGSDNDTENDGNDDSDMAGSSDNGNDDDDSDSDSDDSATGTSGDSSGSKTSSGSGSANTDSGASALTGASVGLLGLLAAVLAL